MNLQNNPAMRTAWFAVMLLWPVVLLNYLDRQMLAAMKVSVMKDMKEQARKILARGNIAFTKKRTFDRLVGKEQEFLRYHAFLSFARNVKSEHVKRALELCRAVDVRSGELMRLKALS